MREHHDIAQRQDREHLDDIITALGRVIAHAVAIPFTILMAATGARQVRQPTMRQPPVSSFHNLDRFGPVAP